MDWLDLLAVQVTIKNVFQHHSSKVSVLWHSTFFIVQLSHQYMTTGKTIALSRQTFVGKVMSLLLNMLSRLVIAFLPRSKHLLISFKFNFNFFRTFQVKRAIKLSFVMLMRWLWEVQFSHAVVSHSLWPHGLQHARPPCPSSTPGVYSNSHPLSRWCHPTISSSVIPFSSCLQSLPASGSFPMSQFFPSGGQSIGVSDSTSVLPMNILD